MDGRNSSGRRISLLNDDRPPLSSAVQRFPSLHSRTSSYTSTGALSPPTPQLVRSDSSDSAAAYRTPSPVTPNFCFEVLHPRINSPSCSITSSSTYKEVLAVPVASGVPQQIHKVLSQPGYTLQQPASYQLPPFSSCSEQAPPSVMSPASISLVISVSDPTDDSASSSGRSQSSGKTTGNKKNHYPCPMAKQFGCTDLFTTSGHAARHAKKHTGKKDAFCPECNKAFTRKDNMEQHRRTHQSGRNAVKDGVQSRKAHLHNSAPEQKQQLKRAKQTPSEEIFLPPFKSELRLGSPASTISAYDSVDTVPASISPSSPPVVVMQQRPLLQRLPPIHPPHACSPDLLSDIMPRPEDISPGLSHGLETLAIAASGQKRKYET